MKRYLTTLLLLFSCLLGAEERTLSLIKPDAVANGHIGEIVTSFEKDGLRIKALQMVFLTEDQAKAFYAVHKERPFFDKLTAFMSSGPIVAIVLEGEEAIARNRTIMGATDPQKAAPGTLRARFGTSITQNAVHGSDSAETAKSEIAFFFPNI